MGTLRPVHPETGATKAYEEYTPEECEGTIAEMELASMSIPVDAKAAAIANELKIQTPKKDLELGLKIKK